jgi:hypothetical protein
VLGCHDYVVADNSEAIREREKLTIPVPMIAEVPVEENDRVAAAGGFVVAPAV